MRGVAWQRDRGTIRLLSVHSKGGALSLSNTGLAGPALAHLENMKGQIHSTMILIFGSRSVCAALSVAVWKETGGKRAG